MKRDEARKVRSIVERFGYGLKPGELAKIGSSPGWWLQRQLEPRAVNAATGVGAPGNGLATANAYGLWWNFYQDNQAAAKRAYDQGWEVYDSERRALLKRQANSDTPFLERWFAFFANHLALSARKETQVRSLCGAYEREVIRAHALGRFEDMLIASARHPAMLVYLDLFRSSKPYKDEWGNPRGGINENYAREALELHTVGSGYGQKDVKALAEALTGWTLERHRGRFWEPLPRFVFVGEAHIDGPQTVMGKRFDLNGAEQGEAILRHLARHKRTARRMAWKIARHFVSDSPPGALVKALYRRWLESGGNLRVVAQELVNHPKALAVGPAKFKSPNDFVVSLGRASGKGVEDWYSYRIHQMGQPTWDPPSPEGFPDNASGWINPGALMARIGFVKDSGLIWNLPDGRSMAQSLYGSALGDNLKAALDAADKPPERLQVLWSSPDFQWRR